MKHSFLFLTTILLLLFTSVEAQKVLYIGDSITDGGWGRSAGSAMESKDRDLWDQNHIYGHSYVLFCAAHYQCQQPNADWQFMNRGISGNTLEQMALRWHADALSLAPDVISVLIGVNDVLAYEGMMKDKGLDMSVEGFDYKGWEKQYRDLIKTTRETLPDVRFVLCTPFAGNNSRSKEFRAITERLAQIVRRIAADNNAVLVPFDKLFAELQKNTPTQKYWIWDGIHPTAAGHMKMAELWQQSADGLFQAKNHNSHVGATNGRWPKLMCEPNKPLGEGKGIHPGRVAWVHASGVATWDGTTGLWMEDRWNNQEKADDMVVNAVKTVAGEKDVTTAWKSIFRNFNETHKRGSRGYKKGETIAIKLNMNNALTHHDTIELNSSPFITLALVRNLVKYAKVRQKDIVVCEPSRAITDSIYNKIHREFPDVRFVDNIGGDGREKCEYYPERITYSVDNGKMARGIAKCVVDADYVINSALLKTHKGPGVTLTGKNWYGATDINLLWRQNAHNNVSQDKRNGKPAYKTFVDWISHPDLGGKCLLFLIDGTYGSRDVNGKPYPKWQKAPFNNEWACSLILSQDPLAGDAVAMDMIIKEWPEFGSLNYCDEYLIEAATIPNTHSGTIYLQNGKPLTSPLGLFEHCDKDGRYTKLDLQFIEMK